MDSPPEPTRTEQAPPPATFKAVATVPIYVPRTRRQTADVPIQPIAEVLAEIGLCRTQADRRSITAILRFAHDQVSARSRYVPYITNIRGFLGGAILCLLTSFFVTGWYRDGDLATAGFLGACVLGFMLSYRPVRFIHHVYMEEIPQILNASIQAIEELIDRGLLPKRMYGEDWRTLKFLAAKDRRFGPYRQVLVQAFRAEPRSGD